MCKRRTLLEDIEMSWEKLHSGVLSEKAGHGAGDMAQLVTCLSGVHRATPRAA